MKKFFLLLVIILSGGVKSVYSQIYVNHTYFNAADYKNKNQNHKGTVNANLIRAGVNLPVSRYVSPDREKIRVWTAFVNAGYLKMNETSSFQQYPINELLNVYTGTSHFRTLSERWSLMAYAGLGICTDNSRLSHLRWNNVTFFGLGTAIYKVNPQLDLGVGAILTNAFDTPIILPSLYIKWISQGRYSFNLVSRSYDIDASLGMRFNERWKISWAARLNRVGAPVKDENGQNFYYSFNNFATGLRPELKLTRHLSLPLEVGVAATGTGQYRQRHLSGILKVKDSYRFKACPYVSVGLTLGM